MALKCNTNFTVVCLFPMYSFYTFGLDILPYKQIWANKRFLFCLLYCVSYTSLYTLQLTVYTIQYVVFYEEEQEIRKLRLWCQWAESGSVCAHTPFCAHILVVSRNIIEFGYFL